MFGMNTHSKIRNRGDVVEHYVAIDLSAAGAVVAVRQGGVNHWTVTKAGTGLYRMKAPADLSKRPPFHVAHFPQLATNSTVAQPLHAEPCAVPAWTQETGELFIKLANASGVATDTAVAATIFVEIVQQTQPFIVLQ